MPLTAAWQKAPDNRSAAKQLPLAQSAGDLQVLGRGRSRCSWPVAFAGMHLPQGQTLCVSDTLGHLQLLIAGGLKRAFCAALVSAPAFRAFQEPFKLKSLAAGRCTRRPARWCSVLENMPGNWA